LSAFELGRAPLAEAARHWKSSRALPLYAAGLFAGAGIGLGIAFSAYDPGGQPDFAAAAPASSIVPLEPRAFGIPAAVAIAARPTTEDPGVVLIVDGPPAHLVLPGDLSLIPPPVVPPVAPVNPIVAQAPAPAAQPAPAAAQPAPAAQPQPPAASLPQTQPPVTAEPEPEPAAAAQPEPAPAGKPNFYAPAVPQGGLNSLEQRFLDAANAERVAAGMAPLRLEHGLTIIARTRSQQLVDQGYFGHKDPYGYSMYVELLALNGYTTYAWAGENLAMNNFAESESPERAVVALMKSPTHKRNILATEFTRIGVGLVTMDDGRKYYTMIFLS
jgi:uncharacterized protein YkwD